jgi:hypothetical protein
MSHLINAPLRFPRQLQIQDKITQIPFMVIEFSMLDHKKEGRSELRMGITDMDEKMHTQLRVHIILKTYT